MKKIAILFFVLSFSVFGQSVEKLTLPATPQSKTNLKFIDTGEEFIFYGYIWDEHLGLNRLFVKKTDHNGIAITTFGNNGSSIYTILTGITIPITAIHENGILTILLCDQYEESSSAAKYAMIKIDQAGNLVESFGSGGIKELSLNTYTHRHVFSTTTEDSKFYVIERGFIQQQTLSFLHCLNADGDLVAGFGNNGTLEYSEENSDLYFERLFKAEDHIYIAGNGAFNDSSITLYRVSENGFLDPTFGDNGKKELETGQYTNSVINSISVKDDEILVLLRVFPPQTSYFYFLVKADTSGNVISDFGDEGIVQLNTFGMQKPQNFISQLDDGNCLYGYTDYISPISPVIIKKIKPDGQFDPEFGNDGKITITQDMKRNKLYQMQVVEDKIYTFSRSAVIQDFRSFNLDGENINSFSYFINTGSNFISGIKADPEGNIIVGGFAVYESQGFPYFRKILPDFTLDPEYSSSPMLFSSEKSNFYLSDFEVNNDGSCNAVCLSGDYYYGYPFEFNKIDAKGVLDSSITFDSTITYYTLPKKILKMEDGYLIYLWRNPPVGKLQPALMKVKNRGQVDSTFGVNGFTPELNDDYAYTTDTEVVQDEAGRIYFQRSIWDNFEILRLNPDGLLDETFCDNGILNNFEYTRAIFPADNWFDTFHFTNFHELKIRRTKFDGTPDSTFGENGVVEHFLDNSLALNNVTQTDFGYIVLSHDYSADIISIIKLDNDGALDNAFGDDGIFSFEVEEKFELWQKFYMIYQDDYLYLSNMHESDDMYAPIYRVNIYAPLRVENKQVIDKSWSLSQNYPNPFNPKTTINFSLAKPGAVKLTVYNALGEKVKTLVNGELSEGNHNVQFDGNNLASGIYFYKLETTEFTSTMKMILLK